MNYEYDVRFVPMSKKGWRDFGATLNDLPRDGWELFMAVPITEIRSYWFGLTNGGTTMMTHYYRREIPAP